VAHATAQCLQLLRNGAPGIHFYTLNKSSATRMILEAIHATGQFGAAASS
ncbi:MAG: methylenetetrahydrofolate reductase, partial [Gammaproteobacteria bacterium]